MVIYAVCAVFRLFEGAIKPCRTDKLNPLGVTRRSRQPHQFTCVPYVGTWFIGGFDIDVAYQIKDLGNIAVQ